MKKTNLRWLWMLLCCLAPVLVILVLAIGGWNFSSFIYVIAILLCPLSMLFMMLSGRRSDRSSAEGDNHFTDRKNGK